MQKLLLALSLFAYAFFAFFFKERSDFWLYFWGIGVLFALYAVVNIKAKYTLREIFVWAILFRLIFLIAFPVLSDDFYRFIWDGYLSKSNLNPYEFIPINYQGPMIEGLLEKLNSPNYYSLYPPLKQGVFALCSFLSGDEVWRHVVSLRLVLLAAACLTIYLIYKIGQYHYKDEKKALKITALYAFNPLVILETAGNLHFEGMMLCFLLASYYLYVVKAKLKWAAVLFALSVSIKLLPLMIMPLIWKKLGFRKGLVFSSIVALCSLILFLPFYEKKIVLNVFTSLDLYFHHFEFNASIYYILRELGYLFAGFNIIHWSGTALAIISLSLILGISFKSKQSRHSILFIWSIYLLLSTTIHPWYIIPLFGISLFTPYKYPLLWTALVGFSYAAYMHSPAQENFLLVILEYSSVTGLAIWELKRRKLFSPNHPQ